MLASLPTPARSALQRSRKTPKSNKVTFESEQMKRKRPAIVRSGANGQQSFEAEQTASNRSKRSKREETASNRSKRSKREETASDRSKRSKRRGNEQS
jgi:hypothetical protein